MLRFRDNFTDYAKIVNPEINPYAGIVATDAALPISAGSELRSLRGKWRETLNIATDSPLVLEIGCHLGDVLVKLAANYPAWGVLGMDITYKRVVSSAQRVASHANTRVLLANAHGISDLFAASELDQVLVFFPDPWRKRRQAKNRLLNPNFCRDLVHVLRPKVGGIWLKTDQEPYYAEAMESLLANGFTQDSLPDFFPELESRFESRFQAKGQATFSGYFRTTKVAAGPQMPGEQDPQGML